MPVALSFRWYIWVQAFGTDVDDDAATASNGPPQQVIDLWSHLRRQTLPLHCQRYLSEWHVAVRVRLGSIVFMCSHLKGYHDIICALTSNAADSRREDVGLWSFGFLRNISTYCIRTSFRPSVYMHYADTTSCMKPIRPLQW